jgi:hypothetical protein
MNARVNLRHSQPRCRDCSAVKFFHCNKQREARDMNARVNLSSSQGGGTHSSEGGAVGEDERGRGRRGSCGRDRHCRIGVGRAGDVVRGWGCAVRAAGLGWVGLCAQRATAVVGGWVGPRPRWWGFVGVGLPSICYPRGRGGEGRGGEARVLVCWACEEGAPGSPALSAGARFSPSQEPSSHPSIHPSSPRVNSSDTFHPKQTSQPRPREPSREERAMAEFSPDALQSRARRRRDSKIRSASHRSQQQCTLSAPAAPLQTSLLTPTLTKITS